MENGIQIALDPERMVCPRCGCHYVNKSHVSYKRYGVCEICYMRACTDAYTEEKAVLTEKRANGAARQARLRERRRSGNTPNGKRGKNVEPRFT